MRRIFFLWLLLCSVFGTEQAASKIENTVYVPIGLNLGYTWGNANPNNDGDGSGFFLGAEVSYVALKSSMIWYGAYFDVVHQFDEARTRLSLGPEFGFFFGGLDGGYVLEFHDCDARHGVQARCLVYYAFGGVYIRGGGLWNPQGDVNGFGEVGVLLKFPIELSAHIDR